MSELKRRDFLKTTVAGIAAGTILKRECQRRKQSDCRAPEQMAQKSGLPDIPTCDSMRSIVMTHKFGDLYALPGTDESMGLRAGGDGCGRRSQYRVSAVRTGRNERRAARCGRRTFDRRFIC